ncbi:unnamed protein product, partial [marine sediment metagenome]
DREITKILNIEDSTFLKKVSITKKDWGGGFTETSTQVISRIDEGLGIIQVEVSKLFDSLRSYI